MTIFYFPQYEHELFWRYFKRLNIFLAQYGYYVGKWKILDIVDEGVNSKTRAILVMYLALQIPSTRPSLACYQD